jgi:hypothetical protein
VKTAYDGLRVVGIKAFADEVVDGGERPDQDQLVFVPRHPGIDGVEAAETLKPRALAAAERGLIRVAEK